MALERYEANQCFVKSVGITQEMIKLFAAATGDNNPIHLDDSYARHSIFETRVAHGMLLAGILSGIMGTMFPGLGTIYLSQAIRFKKPVFPGDTITFHLVVLKYNQEKNRLRIETTGLNQLDVTVFTGEAEVMPPLDQP